MSQNETPTLTDELKAVIARRLEIAQPREVLAIVSGLHGLEQETATEQAMPARLPEAATRVEPWPATQSVFHVGESIVVDQRSGLTWTRAHLLDFDKKAQLKWEAAKTAAERLGDGWRLPTLRELLDLVDFGSFDPAIDSSVFPECESDYFWTSTPYAGAPKDEVWIVDFSSGCCLPHVKTQFAFVRAVRS